MKENQNDQRNQGKTGSASTQQKQQVGTKKETNPNNPMASPGKQQGQAKKDQSQSKNTPTPQKGKKA